MMKTQTVIKTLLLCGIFILGVESTSTRATPTSKGDARRAAAGGVSNGEIQRAIEAIKIKFKLDPVGTLSNQMERLEDIASQLVAWESTTVNSSTEYEMRIVPYAKIMKVFEKSNATYIQCFKEKYENQAQLYMSMGTTLAKGINKVGAKVLQGEWWSGLGELCKTFPAIWSRYQIVDHDGDIGNFDENMMKPGFFCKCGTKVDDFRMNYEPEFLTTFLHTFKADISSLRLFFESLKRIETEDVEVLMKDTAESINTKTKIADFQEQYVENNEYGITILKKHLEFSHKQTHLKSTKSLFAMSLLGKEKEKLKKGTEVYHKDYHLGKVVEDSHANGNVICMFNSQVIQDENITLKLTDPKLKKVVYVQTAIINPETKLIESVVIVTKDTPIKRDDIFTVTFVNRLHYYGLNIDKKSSLQETPVTGNSGDRACVVSVDPRSFAHLKGVKQGLHVLQVGGKRVDDMPCMEVLELIKKQGEIAGTRICRGGSATITFGTKSNLDDYNDYIVAITELEKIETITPRNIVEAMFNAISSTNTDIGKMFVTKLNVSSLDVARNVITDFCDTVETLRRSQGLAITKETAELENKANASSGDVANKADGTDIIYHDTKELRIAAKGLRERIRLQTKTQ